MARAFLIGVVVLALAAAAQSQRVDKTRLVQKLLISNDIATIPSFGSIKGMSCGGYDNVSMFLGVPYARAKRFAAPEVWNRQYPVPYLTANTQPNPCAQRRKNPYDIFDEDCLKLNIFTPNNLTGSGVPVRVFIHGGWFQEGSAKSGSFFEERNLENDFLVNPCRAVAWGNFTLVVIQYRLGPLGFLAHPITFGESQSTGNWGILDQQAALQWVSRYIQFFGGNSSVTIQGHDAGAVSVGIHMVSQPSWPFFSGAIMHNAGAIKLFTQNDAYKAAYKLADALKCPKNPEQQLACLRAAKWEAIINATKPVKAMYQPLVREWFPVIDGFAVPQQPLDLIATGQFNPVPVMFVISKDVGRSYVYQHFDGQVSKLTMKNVNRLIGNVYYGANPMQIVHHYWIGYPYENTFQQISAIWTDMFVTCPILDTMLALSQYRFPPTKPCKPNSPFFVNPNAPCQVPITVFVYERVQNCTVTTKLLGASAEQELTYIFNLEPQGTVCEMTPANENAAFETMWGFNSFTNVGVASYANGSGWGMWNPKTQAVMVADDSPGVSYQARDYRGICSTFDTLARPPSATPIIPILTKPFPITSSGGFPLGLFNGHTLEPPPPPSPEEDASSAGRHPPHMVALVLAFVLATFMLFLSL